MVCFISKSKRSFLPVYLFIMPLTMSSSLQSSPHFHFPLFLQTRTRLRSPKPCKITASTFSDPLVLSIAEKLEDSNPNPSHPLLQSLRDTSSFSLLSTPWPTSKHEAFRFTDTSFLKNSQITPPLNLHPDLNISIDSPPNTLTVLNGRVVASTSAFAGNIRDFPVNQKISQMMVNDDFKEGDVFFNLNGVGATDVAVVHVPEGSKNMKEPITLRFLYGEGSRVGEGSVVVMNPRVLILVEKGAELAIIEEHSGFGEEMEGKCYWGNVVMEIMVEEGAKVSHTYLNRQGRESAHIKWTLTRQEEKSSYELIEVSTGGRLSRHNLHIQQLGPDTVTEFAAFHVAQQNQIQDLHSRLIMDYPRGFSRQLHKCIVSHSSGQAVFDGNVKVNRLAQQTDAGQLTRSLLLAPRATVNLKPNLQIIADDVKCSHGAAVSDLEEEQLFYFQARGINLQTAREALVFSFGAEVIDKIPFEALRKRVANQVKDVLAAR